MKEELHTPGDSFTAQVPQVTFFSNEGLPVVLLVAVDAITDRGIDLALLGDYISIESGEDMIGFENAVLAPSPFHLTTTNGISAPGVFLLAQHGDGFGDRKFEIYNSNDQE